MRNMAQLSRLRRDDARFPRPLLEIPKPPEALYLEGALPDPERYIYMSVVGSRRFTNYGKSVCEKLIHELAGYPVAVVSGLALGIDAAAHRAALKAGLPTVAIPGSGLDRSVLYPSSNRRLGDEIVAKGGALLSEFEPTAHAMIHMFPQRNRLMAGISRAVLVIEAGARSGTLITARLALDYNRDVLAVPGPIFSENAAGVNRLIAQGATPVTSGAEILTALGIEPRDETSKEESLNLSPEEKKVLRCLREPLGRDELIRCLKLPASEANALLAELEIKGLVSERLGEIRKC
jgi:DNA processing protein